MGRNIQEAQPHIGRTKGETRISEFLRRMSLDDSLLRNNPLSEVDIQTPNVMGFLTQLRQDITAYTEPGMPLSLATLSSLERRAQGILRSTHAVPQQHTVEAASKAENAYSLVTDVAFAKAVKLTGVSSTQALAHAIKEDIEQIGLTAKRAALFQLVERHPVFEGKPNPFLNLLMLYRRGAVRVKFWDVEQDDNISNKLLAHLPIKSVDRQVACLVEGDSEVYYTHRWADSCLFAKPIKENAPQRKVL